jgi:hypothetical protein
MKKSYRFLFEPNDAGCDYTVDEMSACLTRPGQTLCNVESTGYCGLSDRCP